MQHGTIHMKVNVDVAILDGPIDQDERSISTASSKLAVCQMENTNVHIVRTDGQFDDRLSVISKGGPEEVPTNAVARWVPIQLEIWSELA